MSEPSGYLAKRGVTEEQMDRARAVTCEYVLHEARSKVCTGQAQLVQTMGAS